MPGCSAPPPTATRQSPPLAPRSRASYLNLLGHAVGWPSPRGGAQALTDALVAHLRELGGELICDAPVERIESSAGRVTGVTLADGSHHWAGIVMADVMPRALLAMTGDALHGWYRAGLVRFRPGPATLKLDWALDGPIPWTAPEARAAGTVHIGGDEAATIESLDAARRGLAERPFLLLGQQSIADPTRAPAGRHTAWAYTHGPASRASELGSERCVEAVERQVERFAPGFRELDPGPPRARAGRAGGTRRQSRRRRRRWWQLPRPAIGVSPAAGALPYRTPIDGLYLASAATFPGGAVHGVPGDAAARAALRSLRRRR